jgi:Tol biopolymer transport system component
MELVEGEDLSQRIARGPIPIDEALPIAKQIADALEAAHEQGIIHRDLKPANIKVRPDGTVKVLDFGLAKALESAGAMSASHSMSPTITTPAMTQAGMILGTAAYMSPEQAKGKAVDKRADIWAYGCVLFEMLSGRPPFTGETVSETLADVMKSAPPWQTLSASVPANLQELIRRCLVKEPRQRIRDVGDVRLALEGAFETTAPQTTATATSSASGGRLAWVAFAVALLAAVALAIPTVRHLREAPPPVPAEVRLEITTPPTADPVSLAISPDGQKIVFVATEEGRSRLSLRSLDAVSARPLTGTEGASWPFWSPDGRSVGFFADGKLKRIDVDGGQLQNLTDAPAGRGASWNRDGTIIFTPDQGTGPIFRIPAAGGEVSPLTRTESPKQNSHRFPQFLPDGRHFLYYVLGIPEFRGIYIGDLQGSETRRLLDADSAAVYAAPGRLLFVRQGTLFAQDFDAARLELRGNASPMAERIALDTGAQGSAAVSASTAGPFVYRTGSGSGLRQFVWMDRSGKDIGKASDLLSAISIDLSPDGRRVALFQQVNQNFDVWLLELGRGLLSRFTFDPGVERFPIWSPDGSRIVFDSDRKGPFDLYQKPAIGAGTEELLLATAQEKIPTDWSPDGRLLLYRSVDPKTGYDIWALPLDGDGKPVPVVQTNFDERDAQFSPDGKWIAYHSNESGRFEIYIQPFPGPGSKLQVSTNGGAQVRWGPHGKELFYIALDARLMAVPIRLASNPQSAEPGSPTPLFATRVGGALQGTFRQQYDVSSDGPRFLMNTITEEAASPITVVLNWNPEAKK